MNFVCVHSAIDHISFARHFLDKQKTNLKRDAHLVLDGSIDLIEGGHS